MLSGVQLSPVIFGFVGSMRFDHEVTGTVWTPPVVQRSFESSVRTCNHRSTQTGQSAASSRSLPAVFLRNMLD